MSSHEPYDHRALLERDPSLLAEVERLVKPGINEKPSFPNQQELPIASQTMVHDDWPEPRPLGGELPPVQPFDIALLPESLRPLVEDTAERMQVPLDYPAVVAVLCLAGVTNRRATIQPKAADTSWIVVPNLWGGIIAPPSWMKSPVISAITQPLKQVEALWRVEYESAKSDYQEQQEEAELRRAAWRELFEAAQKKGKDGPVRPDDSLAAPICRRLLTQDATNPCTRLCRRIQPGSW